MRRRSSLLLNPRRRRRYRRNAWYNNAAGHAKAARKGWRARRGTPTKRRKRKNPYKVRHVLTRSNRRRRYRRNPNGIARGMRRAISQQWIMRSLTIGGGIAGGAAAMPLVYKMVPEANRAQVSPWLGLVHVLLGSVMNATLRNRNMKELGAVIAGTGVYDLLVSNIPQLGLPALPRSGGLAAMLPNNAGVSASYPVARRPVSGVAASGVSPVTSQVGSSYLPSYTNPGDVVGASYEAPGSRTVGLSGTFGPVEDPYGGIFE